MTWIVRVALERPLTFIVMALLIVIAGPLAAMSMPTDIFPDIRIPVIGVAFQFTGLSPDEMSGRIVTPYERILTTTVNDIEHIESTSIPGIGIEKIYFQPGVDIRTATAQVTSISQTVLKQLPPGATPPLILNYNASTVPILQLAFSGDHMSEQQVLDLAQNFVRPVLSTIPGAAIPYSYGGKVRQLQIDLDSQSLQARGLSAQDVENAIAAQNQILPAGTVKFGATQYTVKLNDAAETIEDLNNIPIKSVNGATVYIHDVGHVRDGNPPQQSLVHVDGARAVLTTILKTGSASTLDIVAGVKGLLPGLQATLPAGFKVNLFNDQSVFVKAAIAGVVREGIIAAALTSLMILLFLGSWRSTIIIAISIPLAILCALAALWFNGQTLNIMTLGGLALAVGILVDDATVTIENINWHLEHGKGVTQAILDGAQQIVQPAFVSLLCICIVFVPMFALRGVAGFLFVPMAEAVVFAMIASFLLSRTLVPTMAMYLLRPHAEEEAAHAASGGNVLSRFQRGFEARFDRFREGYRNLLAMALGNSTVFIIGFLAFVFVSFVLYPLLGSNFFPSVDSGQITLHVRPPVGTRIEHAAAMFGDIEREIRRTVPPGEISSIVDNIGLPTSAINTVYNNSGLIGYQDGDIFVTLTQDHGPHRQLCAPAARDAAGEIPRHRVLLPARRHHQPDPELRRAGADRPADRRPQAGRRPQICARPAAPAERHPRPGRRAHAAILPQSATARRRRPLAHGAARPHRARRHQQRRDLACRQLADRADLLAESADRRLLSHRGADAGIPGDESPGAGEPAGHRFERRASDPGRPWPHLARTVRRHRVPLQRPAYHRSLRHDAGSRPRRRGGRYPRAGRRLGQGSAARRQGQSARPGRDDGRRLHRPVLRSFGRDRPDLPADRREFPILARSVRDRHRAAGGAGRHRLDAVRHRHDFICAGAYRRDHVHGRGDRQLDPGRQFRARAAGSDRRRRAGGGRGRRHPFSVPC